MQEGNSPQAPQCLLSTTGTSWRPSWWACSSSRHSAQFTTGVSICLQSHCSTLRPSRSATKPAPHLEVGTRPSTGLTAAAVTSLYMCAVAPPGDPPRGDSLSLRPCPTSANLSSRLLNLLLDSESPKSPACCRQATSGVVGGEKEQVPAVQVKLVVCRWHQAEPQTRSQALLAVQAKMVACRRLQLEPQTRAQALLHSWVPKAAGGLQANRRAAPSRWVE